MLCTSDKALKKLLYILIFIHITILPLIAQPVTQEWVRRFNDTSNVAWQAFSVKSDSQGYIYVLVSAGVSSFGFLKYNSNGDLLVYAHYWPGGYESGGGRHFDVAPNGDVYITGLVNQFPYSHIYTVKFNASGVFQWGKYYGPDIDDVVSDIKVDKSGNIILSGSAYDGYGLTIKYNPGGDTLWVKKFRPGFPAGNGNMAIDSLNNIYITGGISPYGIPGETMVLKYDQLGNFKWFNRFTIDSTKTNGGHGIVLDNYGNIYVLALSNAYPSFKDYLLKLTNSGTILWNRIFNGIIGIGEVSGIPKGPVVSSDGSSIYYTTEAVNGLGGGGRSVATIKYNSNGDSQWVGVYNGGGIYGTANSPGNISLDKFNNIYICAGGYYQTTGADIALIKYNSSGNQQWIQIYTGILTNGGESANDLYIDTSLNIYVVGNSPNTYGGKAAVTIKYNQFLGITTNNGKSPDAFKLFQNYPNPFNPATKIKFSIPPSRGARGVTTRLIIYDVLGREIAVLVNANLIPGTYEAEFDGSNYPSGVYFYRLSASEYSESKKMILLK
jgi:hypothetical protein